MFRESPTAPYFLSLSVSIWHEVLALLIPT